MDKTKLTQNVKPPHTNPECKSVICRKCGKALLSDRDRIGRSDERCICPDCYREYLRPNSGRKFDGQCL